MKVVMPMTADELQWLANGRKSSFTDNTKHGEIGDTFVANKKTYVITQVIATNLLKAYTGYYKQEGFYNAMDMRLYWERKYKVTYKPDIPVVVHLFKEKK